MRIVILTEGGRGIGFGHITRCLSLYQAFEEQGLSPELIINGDRWVKQFFKGQPFAYRLLDWQKATEENWAFLDEMDVAVVDSYLASESFYQKLATRVPLPIYLDDFQRIAYPTGMVINGAMSKTQIEYPKRRDVEYYVGLQYTFIRKAFWNVAEKTINKDIKSIMVTFGGTDGQNMTPRVLRMLTESFPDLKKIVLIGKGFNNVKLTEAQKDKKTKFLYHINDEKMRNLMTEVDLAISSGGQTLYELARVGVPTMGIRVSDNQRQNLEFLHHQGFLEYVGSCHDSDVFWKLSKGIQQLFDQEVRMKHSRLGRKLIDGQGVRRIVKIVLDKMENAISVSKEDSYEEENV